MLVLNAHTVRRRYRITF